MCAIRACVCEGEATGQGEVRCGRAVEGSRRRFKRVSGWGQYVGLGVGVKVAQMAIA